MSDLIIKIGDDALDLSSGETVALTRQAAKVGDFVAVMADGTNEVTVPLTANNRKVLDNANIITTDSVLPYRRTDATMIQEGYETITNGYAIVKSSADNFSLQVVGGNGGFFDLIRNLNLRDLDLLSYAHFWTNLNAFNGRNNTDGYVYAVFEQSDGNQMIDSTMRIYGTNLYAVHTNKLLPCFHAKTLVSKIFSEQGYTFVTDLGADPIYDGMVVYNGMPNRGDEMSHHLCTVTRLSATLFAGGYIFGDVGVTAGSVYTSAADFLTWLQTPEFKFKLTDPCTITVDFRIELLFTGLTAYTTTMRMDVDVTRAGGIAVVSSNTVTINVGTSSDPNAVYDFTMTFDVGDFDGDIYFRPYNVVGFSVGFVMAAGTSCTVTSAIMLANTEISTYFPFSYLNGLVPVPDLKQADFLKDLAKAFQWIYDVNELTKVVTARRFDTVVENIPTAIDLSDRIDTRKQKITYGIDGFAQTNSLAYKPDDISGYDAIGYIDVDDQTLKAEGKYVEVSQFAATSTRTRFDTVDAPFVPIFDDDLPTNGVAHRLLLLKRVTFPYNVNFNRAGDTPPDYATSDLTFAYFAEAGNPASLDFPNLITRFYQTVMAMSFRGKTLECLMNLKIKDVVNYNPFTPVYIQQHGSYFYWQKVSNYVKDKLTKCTFIRL